MNLGINVFTLRNINDIKQSDEITHPRPPFIGALRPSNAYMRR